MISKRRLLTKRGSLLVMAIFIMPIVAGFLFVTLTRSEMALRQTRLDIARAQSRLLAESAIAVYLQEEKTAEVADENKDGAILVSGHIEGIGSYTLTVVGDGSTKGGQRLEATGVTLNDEQKACTILTSEYSEETSHTLRFLTRVTRVEPL